MRSLLILFWSVLSQQGNSFSKPFLQGRVEWSSLFSHYWGEAQIHKRSEEDGTMISTSSPWQKSRFSIFLVGPFSSYTLFALNQQVLRSHDTFVFLIMLTPGDNPKRFFFGFWRFPTNLPPGAGGERHQGCREEQRHQRTWSSSSTQQRCSGCVQSKRPTPKTTHLFA